MFDGPTSEERLRQVELWQRGHEEQCEARHKAIGLRFDAVAADLKERLGNQNKTGLYRALAIIAIVILGGTKHGRELFGLVDLIFP